MSALYLHKNPYDIHGTERQFFAVLRETLKWHMAHCTPYGALARAHDLNPESILTDDDLHKIPPLTTLAFKRHSEMLHSIRPEKWVIKATSSGTRGFQSTIGFDRKTYLSGVAMMLRFFNWHGITSLKPVHYVILGYEPKAGFDLGAAKTAYGTTKFAPALSRTYALQAGKEGHEINFEGVAQTLLKASKQAFPVRFVGFPAYMHFMLQTLEARDLKLKLPQGSKVLLGGGWKQFGGAAVDRDTLLFGIEKYLGIPKTACFEFFSAVEHPLPYCKCANGHFHIPIYSRVVIRDVESLEPLPEGEAGLVNFISPLVRSMPLLSVLTDDIATWHSGKKCGCGIDAPYFEWIARAGVPQIQTCAVNASELANGIRF